MPSQVEQHPLPAVPTMPPQPFRGSLTKFYQWESVSQRIRRQTSKERRKEAERKDGEIQGQGKGEGPGWTSGAHLCQRNSPLCL